MPELPGRRLVADLDARPLRAGQQKLHQAGAAAHRLDGDAAIEAVLAFDQVGLTAEHRHEANAVLGQPGHRRARLVDQGPGQVLVRLVVGDLHQLVVEVLAVVRRQVDLHPLGVREVGQDILGDVVEPFVGEAKATGGEIGIAALLLLRCLFQHQYPGAIFVRADRRAERRVAGAHHHHVVNLGHASSFPLLATRLGAGGAMLYRTPIRAIPMPPHTC